MARPWQPTSRESDLPVLGGLILVLSLFAATAIPLSWLFAPTVLPNPSVAAYVAPPATSLLPAPRKMDAPALVEPSPLTALAAEYEAVPEPAKVVEPPKPVRKTPRRAPPPPSRASPEQAYGFAPPWATNRPWNDGYRERDDGYRQRYDNGRNDGGWNDRSRRRNGYNERNNNRQQNSGWFW